MKLMWELSESFPDLALTVKNGEGRIVFTNRFNASISGWSSPADQIGYTSEELYPPDQAAVYAGRDREVFESGRPIVERLYGFVADRSTDLNCVTVRPIIGLDGSRIGTATIYHRAETKMKSFNWYDPIRKSVGNVARLGMTCRKQLGQRASRPLRGRFPTGKMPVVPVLAATGKMPVVPVSSSPTLRQYQSVAYLNAHYAEDVSVEELAGISHYSVAQFRKLFVKLMHLSPSRYVTQVRINAAKTLLRTTDKLITDIAGETGFCDHSHFIKTFRSETGQTPTEFRRAAFT